MERPKEVFWIELLAFAEVGLSLVQIFLDPIEHSYVWPDILVAILILALTVWFTRGGGTVARWVLIVLNALTILASIYAILLNAEFRHEEIKWTLGYLLLAVLALCLLFSRPARAWVEASADAKVDAASDVV